MTVKKAKELTLEKFSEFDGKFEEKMTQNNPLKHIGENFMEFVRMGSEKLKSDPVIRMAFR